MKNIIINSKAFVFLEKSIEKIVKDSITVYAAQASFYIIIASIPFAFLVFGVGALFIDIDYAQIEEYVGLFLPEAVERIVFYAAYEIREKADGALFGISAVTLMWTASRGTQAVERGVRRVYACETKRGFFRNIFHSMLYTAVFLGVVIVAFVVFVLGDRIILAVSAFADNVGVVYQKTDILRTIGAFFVLFWIFLFVYNSFSGRKERILMHIPGSAFSAVGWMAFSKLYSFYIEYFSNHSYIYGSFAAIVLVMLWLYSCMIIFLFGAEVNKIYIIIRKEGINAYDKKRRNGEEHE